MRMDKLTSRFQQALADAQSLAVGRDNSIIEPVHLFSALLDQQGGSTRPLLAQAGVNVPVLRERLTEALDALPKVSGQAGNVSMGNDLGRLLNQTDKLAQQHGDAFIASEWFVLTALDDGGTLGMALRAAGVDKTRLQAAIDKLRGGENVQSENAEEQRQALEKYTIDLTARAESGTEAAGSTESVDSTDMARSQSSAALNAFIMFSRSSDSPNITTAGFSQPPHSHCGGAPLALKAAIASRIETQLWQSRHSA